MSWPQRRITRTQHHRRPPYSNASDIGFTVTSRRLRTDSRNFEAASRGGYSSEVFAPSPRTPGTPRTGLPSVGGDNCRRGGHNRFNCREPPTLFCFNCGRRGTNLRECLRCGEAHLEYLRAQGDRRNRHPQGREARRPAERQAAPRRKGEVAQLPRPSIDRGTVVG